MDSAVQMTHIFMDILIQAVRNGSDTIRKMSIWTKQYVILCEETLVVESAVQMTHITIESDQKCKVTTYEKSVIQKRECCWKTSHYKT